MEDDGDDASTSEPGSSDESEEDEIPWYDKVLSNDDEPNEETVTGDEDSDPDVPEVVDTPTLDEIDDDPAAGTEESSGNDTESTMTDKPEGSDDPFKSGVQKSHTETEKETQPNPKPAKAASETATTAPKRKKSETPTASATSVTKEPAAAEESFDDIFPRKSMDAGGRGSSSGTYVFLSLFVVVLALFCYYQFYDGHGFHLSFKHKGGGSVADSMQTADHGGPLSHLNPRIEELVAEKEDLEAKIREHKATIEKLRSSGSPVSESSSNTKESGSSSGAKISPNQGTIYQVQVTALRSYNPNLSNTAFELYIDKEEGYTKFLIGAFKSESEVKAFEQKLKKAGFDDTFIVKKVNGKRVEYEPY